MGRPSVAVGDVFDRLTVISILSRRTKQGGLITNCQCLCGNTKLIQARHLIGGGTKSCGCLRREGKFRGDKMGLTIEYEQLWAKAQAEYDKMFSLGVKKKENGTFYAWGNEYDTTGSL